VGFFISLNWLTNEENENLEVVENKFQTFKYTNNNTKLTKNFLGGILSSIALFIQTFADWRLPTEMRDIKPLIPALQSNWLLMHVSIMILSYAALLIGSILAITYIVIISSSNEINWLNGSNTKNFLEELDSLSYRILAFGFPMLTLGILSGAVWANEAWGSYWSWDPKETWALITWLVFAFYLHTRLQYGWEGKKSSYVATFGFFIVWICYLGVNLLGKGLHSYGWLS
jgi:cytochrome c-type biogenesis protein CcsB